ncbi:hypothetical protein ACRAWF_17770 [Streptomyces sp. L7]
MRRRRAGIGGDGLLHVVRSAAHPERGTWRPRGGWFMDYRNGDGSVSEMCGNGVRVFARYLQRAGHAGPPGTSRSPRAGESRPSTSPRRTVPSRSAWARRFSPKGTSR